MSTRLSSLLVQASVVSVKQIERALEKQVLRGGQLDTNLLEIGVSEATLLPHLARSRDLEPAARSVWPTPPANILSMLSPETAQKSGLAPLGKAGGRFYVLTHEAFNATTLAEVSAKLGIAVVPVIIPEFRLHEAHARYYGLPMPPRSAALAAKNPQPPPSDEAAQPDYPWATRSHVKAWESIPSEAVVVVAAPPAPALTKTLSDEAGPFPDETSRLFLPPEARTSDDPTPTEATLSPELAALAAPPPEASSTPLHFDTPTDGLAPVQVPEQDQATPVEAQIPVIAQADAPMLMAQPEPIKNITPTHFDTPSDGNLAVSVAEPQDQATPVEAQIPAVIQIEAAAQAPEVAAPVEVATVETAQVVVQTSEASPPESAPPVAVPVEVAEASNAEVAPVEAPVAAVAETAPVWMLDDIKNALMNADLNRDDIFRYLLVFIGQRAPEAFLFQVQSESGSLMSREGHRQGEGLFYLQGLAVTVPQSPLFQRALTTQSFVMGLLSEDSGLIEFFNGMQRALPSSVFVQPISVKGRVVAVYVGASPGTFSAAEVAEIPALNLLASNALLALIQRKKKSDQRPKERVKPRHGEPYDSDDMNTLPEVLAVRRPVVQIEEAPERSASLNGSASALPDEDIPQIKPIQSSEVAPGHAEPNGVEPQTEPKLKAVTKDAAQLPVESPVETPAPIAESPATPEPAPAPVEVVNKSRWQALASFDAEETPQVEAVFAPAVDEINPFAAPEVEGMAMTDAPEAPVAVISAKAATELLSRTIVDDELDLDPSDLLEELPAVPAANVLADQLVGMQEAFAVSPPRSIPVALTHDLLRQTERLEKEHEALDALAALIQTSKPKKPVDPSQEISKLLEQIDLGSYPDGSLLTHDEMTAAVEKIFSYGDIALPTIFALFPGRRLPKTPGVLRLEEGNLLRLLLRFAQRALPGLTRLASHPGQLTRFYAIWCLASLKATEALPAMIPAMFDADPMVRQVALAGGAQFAKNPEFAAVISTTRRALASPDERYRAFAASLTARFRLVELWPLMAERLEDSSPEVAREALTALMTLTYQDLGPKKKAWVSWFEKHGHLPREAWLIEALSHKELTYRKSAFQELHALSGSSFGYNPDGDKSERRQAIKQWESWLTSKGAQRS